MIYTGVNNNIDEYLEKNLSQARREHVYGVVYEVEKMCDIYKEDKEKCMLAAKFHDIVREKSVEEINTLIKKYNLPKRYLSNVNIAHGKVANKIMKDIWKIEDAGILEAVSYHTTGRAGMTQIEKILFVADAIEPHRDYAGVSELRKIASKSLDEACLKIIENTILYLKKKGISEIDKDTLEAREWFKINLRENREGIMNIKDFAMLAAKVLDDKKGEDIEIFDISIKSSIADYMIIASGSNERLIGAMVDDVEDAFEKKGLNVRSIEGKKESGWILMDFGDIIINILTNEMRNKYNIEKIWTDCDKLIWEE